MVVIWAADGGRPARSASTRVHVVIDDVNDHPPTFDADSYEAWIAEDLAAGTCFLAVSASDRDHGLNAAVTYDIDWTELRPSAPDSRQPFAVDAESGTICLREELDFESQPVFVLPLVARDGGVESLSGRSTLTVNVVDVNDNAPTIVVEVISGSAAGGIEVEENSAAGGLTLALVTVLDADSGANGRVVCGLNDTSAAFRLVEVHDGQYHVTAVSELDREERGVHALVIHCRDLGEPPLSSSAVVSVRSVHRHFSRKNKKTTFRTHRLPFKQR